MEMTWFEIGVDIGLSNLENYRQVMESTLKEHKHKFEEWIDKQAEALVDDEKAEFYEAYSDEHWELSEVFSSTLRSSLFVAAYSVLERELVDYCTELWSKNKFSEKPNIPHRGIIFEARKYLTKYAGISIPDTSPNWNNIVCYNKIRNSIVHSGGKIDAQNLKMLQPFLASNPSIRLDQINKIILGEEVCKDFIKVIRRLFFDDIFKKAKS